MVSWSRLWGSGMQVKRRAQWLANWGKCIGMRGIVIKGYYEQTNKIFCAVIHTAKQHPRKRVPALMDGSFFPGRSVFR